MCAISGTKQIINQPNVYFLCVIICRMEIWHRSDQGLSWDHGNSLGFSRAFLFLPLRTRHWPLRPPVPPLKTQRRRRGMQNVNGQAALAPLERGRTSRCEVWPSSALLALLNRGQKWGPPLFKVFDDQIVKGWPWTINKVRFAQEKAQKCRSRQNKWDRF